MFKNVWFFSLPGGGEFFFRWNADETGPPRWSAGSGGFFYCLLPSSASGNGWSGSNKILNEINKDSFVENVVFLLIT